MFWVTWIDDPMVAAPWMLPEIQGMDVQQGNDFPAGALRFSCRN